MKLYEIDEQILNCIDAETGEIIDADMLNALQMERDAKIEGVALWIKDLNYKRFRCWQWLLRICQAGQLYTHVNPDRWQNGQRPVWKTEIRIPGSQVLSYRSDQTYPHIS